MFVGMSSASFRSQEIERCLAIVLVSLAAWQVDVFFR